jgi:transcription antitermination factor NusG
VGAETLLIWRFAVLLIPPASDRGFQSSPVQASRVFSDISFKKTWFAVYTAPRHEKYVHAQLTAKRIQSFLPLYTTIRKWKNRVRREIQHPLLPGYVFVCLGADERLPVLQTSGVVYFVGSGGAPSGLGDHEMHALRVGAQRAALVPRRLPATGDTVRITRGPFRGVKGCVEQDGDDLTLVVTIQLIHKSFAVRIQAADLELAS